MKQDTSDRGQRYEVRAAGWPKAEMSPICWTDDIEQARSIAKTMMRAPSCTETVAFDRIGGAVIAEHKRTAP